MKAIVIAVAILGLCACASHDTDYVKAQGARDHGFSESQISENRYRVSFKGNRSTSRDKIKDYALMRAAELTILNGHDWFKVMNQDTEQERQSRPVASTSVQSGHHVHRSCGLLGCSTTVTPAYTGTMVMATRETGNGYSTSIEIVMGDGEVDDPTTVYNAKELREFISGKY